MLGPRLVVAGTHSGVGKTTVTTGLLAALRRAGTRVAAAKVGPDFIDPSYHAAATGRPGHNLDAWISGAGAIAPLAAMASRGADVLLIEGVMGMFDGAADPDPVDSPPSSTTANAWQAGLLDEGSTAHIARLLDAPVVLVVDAGALAGSVAAIVHGYRTLDPWVDVAGVVLNHVASEGHERMLRDALAPLDVPVLGALPTDEAFIWRDRHLGLVPVVEHPTVVSHSIDRLAAVVARHIDLAAVMALARRAPQRSIDPVPPSRHVVPPNHEPPRVAVAAGPAFSFSYPENNDRLTQAGAELVAFDPLVDETLPQRSAGLVVGGGFPETYAEDLGANRPLLADVRQRALRTPRPQCAASSGASTSPLVIWAECGGLLWLSRTLDGHQLCDVIPAEARMTDQLTIGYRRATALLDTPLAPAEGALRGHEFHRTAINPPGGALRLTSRFGCADAGHGSPTLLASYLHLHLGADPAPAERFVETCIASMDARA